MKNLLLLSSLVAFSACTVPQTKPPKTIRIDVPNNTGYTPPINNTRYEIPTNTDFSVVDANHNTLLTRGRETLSDGKAKEAILNYFNPIIRDYEKNYASSRQRIFTARTQKEHDAYSRSTRNAKVLSKTWSEAYYLKAYALLELKELQQSEITIGKALKLAPSNSKYLSEVAHLYQLKKEFRRALKSYSFAEKSANLYTPKSLHQKELLRAKRGMAYNLIELRELDRAKKIYKDILKILPRDKIALKELKYIDELKKRR
jgi:tetratricopeptide (TPR) repeat protein